MTISWEKRGVLLRYLQFNDLKVEMYLLANCWKQLENLIVNTKQFAYLVGPSIQVMPQTVNSRKPMTEDQRGDASLYTNVRMYQYSWQEGVVS